TNATIAATTANGSQTLTAAFNITAANIGGGLKSDGTVSDPWNGDIAEFLVYNSSLTDNDRASSEQYFVNTWMLGGYTNTARPARQRGDQLHPDPADQPHRQHPRRRPV